MLNKAMIIGNLGKDPEVRYTGGGTAVCTLSVATSHKWKDKQSGEMREETEWHRVEVFGKQAELCGEHLKKGRTVYCEGRIKTDSWEDKQTGQKKYATKIVADWVKFLGGGKSEKNEHPNVQGAREVLEKGSEQEPREPGSDDVEF
jgi:single-strand DNA-binding protein